MSEKVLKFAQRVNEAFPEIPINDLIEIWEGLDEEPSVEGLDEEPTVKNPTCKHKFLKGRNANTQCKTKVKGVGEYCSKHKK